MRVLNILLLCCFLIVFPTVLFAENEPRILILNSDISVEKYKTVHEEFKKTTEFPIVEINLSDRKLKISKVKNLLSGEHEVFLDNSSRVKLSHGLFDSGAVILKGLKSEKVILRSEKGTSKVTLDFPGFTHFGIWKQAETDAPYVCLEPWFGVDSTEGTDPDIFTKDGILTLEPGAEFRHGYSITLD